MKEEGGYWRKRRAIEDEDKLENQDPDCFEEIKHEIEELKEEMEKEFPMDDDFQKPACVKEQKIDLTEFKVEMAKIKKKCSKSEDKQACLDENMPEELDDSKKQCLDEVQEIFADIKEEIQKHKENPTEEMEKEGGYWRKRRAIEDEDKLENQDPECFEEVKHEIEEIKEEMEKEFPMDDDFQKPACVKEQKIDLTEFKVEMAKIKKKCSKSDDKQACLDENMPEELDDSKKQCIDELHELFEGIKEVKEQEKEVDLMLEDFEKPSCAANWDIEQIK